MADTDNTVVGYNYFDPITGGGASLTVNYLPFVKVWDTDPTSADVSGVDKSGDFLPEIVFDLSNPEDLHRGRVIQYVRNTLGRDISVYLNDLPDDFLSDSLYNVAYNRPMRGKSLMRLRIGDTLVVNPYALSQYYLVMWLLSSMADDLKAQPASSLVRNGQILANLADHLQYTIDRILVKFNLSEPDSSLVIEGYRVTLGTSYRTKLYVSQERFDAFVAEGGDELLMVADYALNQHAADASSIADKTQILAAWEQAQTPPSS